MRLILADHDITLGPGEVAEFDTRVPHWFGPAGDQPVEILSLLGRQGERIHVRGAPRRKANTYGTRAAKSPSGHQGDVIPRHHPALPRFASCRRLPDPMRNEETDMTITTSMLMRAAGVSAVLSGLLFILIQPIHPEENSTTVTSTAWMVVAADDHRDGRPRPGGRARGSTSARCASPGCPA